MKLKLIRNATMVIEYAGVRFLIDPMFAPKGTMPSFAAASGNTDPNPIVDLPEDPNKTMEEIDAVILTHSHPDHWDQTAADILNKDIPFFVQDHYDKELIEKAGFKHVKILPGVFNFNGVTLTRTTTQHFENEATRERLKASKVIDVMGLILQANNEKTVYLVSDTVWFNGVKEALDVYHPEVVVVNAGGNAYPEGKLIMDADDVLQVHEAAPDSTIVAVHMEAANHYGTTRAELKELGLAKTFTQQLYVPDDGDVVEF